MAVRKITNKGSKKVIGKFASHKLQTTVWWESQIERDYIYLFEIDRVANATSIEPRSFKRGNLLLRKAILTARQCFNRATFIRTWKRSLARSAS